MDPVVSVEIFLLSHLSCSWSDAFYRAVVFLPTIIECRNMQYEVVAQVYNFYFLVYRNYLPAFICLQFKLLFRCDEN